MKLGLNGMAMRAMDQNARGPGGGGWGEQKQKKTNKRRESGGAEPKKTHFSSIVAKSI